MASVSDTPPWTANLGAFFGGIMTTLTAYVLLVVVLAIVAILIIWEK